eukprot:467761-Pelagomonas_calceolata.AAC.2
MYANALTSRLTSARACMSRCPSACKYVIPPATLPPLHPTACVHTTAAVPSPWTEPLAVHSQPRARPPAVHCQSRAQPPVSVDAEPLYFERKISNDGAAHAPSVRFQSKFRIDGSQSYLFELETGKKIKNPPLQTVRETARFGMDEEGRWVSKGTKETNWDRESLQQKGPA